jgi:hypothetical protein
LPSQRFIAGEDEEVDPFAFQPRRDIARAVPGSRTNAAR